MCRLVRRVAVPASSPHTQVSAFADASLTRTQTRLRERGRGPVEARWQRVGLLHFAHPSGADPFEQPIATQSVSVHGSETISGLLSAVHFTLSCSLDGSTTVLALFDTSLWCTYEHSRIVRPDGSSRHRHGRERRHRSRHRDRTGRRRCEPLPCSGETRIRTDGSWRN